jgi:hypothetical protein
MINGYLNFCKYYGIFQETGKTVECPGKNPDWYEYNNECSIT